MLLLTRLLPLTQIESSPLASCCSSFLSPSGSLLSFSLRWSLGFLLSLWLNTVIKATCGGGLFPLTTPKPICHLGSRGRNSRQELGGTNWRGHHRGCRLLGLPALAFLRSAGPPAMGGIAHELGPSISIINQECAPMDMPKLTQTNHHKGHSH